MCDLSAAMLHPILSQSMCGQAMHVLRFKDAWSPHCRKELTEEAAQKAAEAAEPDKKGKDKKKK